MLTDGILFKQFRLNHKFSPNQHPELETVTQIDKYAKAPPDEVEIVVVMFFVLV